MTLHLTWNQQTYRITDEAIDLAIGMDFYGPQPSIFGVAPARGEAFESGAVIGDVRRGGSVNFETYSLTPHCNGTHTECVGHITEERIHVHSILRESWMLTTVVSISPTLARETTETYDPPLSSEDRVITRAALQAARSSLDTPALVIRTLPNVATKRFQDYLETPPPFFTLEAMSWITEQGVHHLLVDMPSVDRAADEGKLRNHRQFWGLAPGARSVDPTNPPMGTITEMIFIPNEVEDGLYVLELQLAAFLADAAPSRPRLFRLTSDL